MFVFDIAWARAQVFFYGLHVHSCRYSSMSQMSTAFGRDEVRLVCSPKRTAQLLDVSISTVYQLMAAGELDHFLDGKSRRIATASIEAYVARRLAGKASRRPASREARKAASQRIAE